MLTRTLATTNPQVTEAAVPRRYPGLPFGDPSRRQRLIKVGAWLVGIALALVVLHLLGVDIIGWLSDLWDQIKAVPGRLHRCRTRLPDWPDVLGRALLLRHPARGLPRPGRVLADRDRLCGRGGDEQFPAGEHRHVRDAAHVRRDHPHRDVRGLDRRLPGAEDLLHDRGHLRLPVPLPLRAGLVQREPRQHLRQPGRLDPDRRSGAVC